MEDILKYVELIEDSRQQSKILHKLSDIVIIVLFAKLANADDWEEIEDFAECHEEFLKKYIRLENGVPSHDTIQRVMGIINPQYMQDLYTKWNELVSSDEGKKIKKIIAIDGKTMCGNKVKDTKPNHIVSAWCDEDGFCLGQKAVDDKSNEITAIPQLLDTINVKGNIITIDAIGTQTAIAENIKSKRADYVLAVKENQKNLYEEIKDYFDDKELRAELKLNGSYKKTSEKCHSQIEIREYYQCADIKWMQEKSRWKGIKSVAMVQKTIKKDDTTTVEKRYYISSLSLDIDTMARAIRRHWSVEIMHWHLDVTFKEDANSTLDKIAAQNLNIINKWCLSILKLFEVGKKKKSLRKKRFHICMNAEKYIEEILEL